MTSTIFYCPLHYPIIFANCEGCVKYDNGSGKNLKECNRLEIHNDVPYQPPSARCSKCGRPARFKVSNWNAEKGRYEEPLILCFEC